MLVDFGQEIKFELCIADSNISFHCMHGIHSTFVNRNIEHTIIEPKISDIHLKLSGDYLVGPQFIADYLHCISGGLLSFG